MPPPGSATPPDADADEALRLGRILVAIENERELKKFPGLVRDAVSKGLLTKAEYDDLIKDYNTVKNALAKKGQADAA